MIRINTIANKFGIKNKYIINYGKYMAKVDLSIISTLNKESGKLILVTSTNPTPYGEGKTTMAIGLNDSLNKIGKNSIVVLREPSMGPVFGVKGGATGGGKSLVLPEEDINLHFTGDMHALTSANNLLCAIIDNHIYQGNELKIKEVLIPRCLDVNDRALRSIDILTKGNERKDKFSITVATELMAILCLSKDFNNLRERIANMMVAYDENDKPIYVKDLNCLDALVILLKDAINPNIVQTKEKNLAIIHGGPFANIAHGTNSIIATKLGLKLADYVVTEAGFGSDLGAEKYFDIVLPILKEKLSLLVINSSIRALKYNGNNNLKEGLCNLKAHIDNMKLYTNNILVVLNKFSDDTKEEINILKDFVLGEGVEFTISSTYMDGSKGGIDFANKVVELTNKDTIINKLYDDNDTIENKIDKIVKNIYHAGNIIYSDEAKKDIERLKQLKLTNYPICMAKTPMSLSDNPKILGYPKDYDFHINHVYINTGAGFIVAISGSILTLPGLAKHSAYENMKIDKNKKIKGMI